MHTKWHNPNAEKKHTVAYCGGTHDHLLRKFVEVIRKFPDSVHISHQEWHHGTVTHLSVTDAERMQIMNETKISVVKNNHFGNYANPVKNLPNWDKYKWTSNIEDN